MSFLSPLYALDLETNLTRLWALDRDVLLEVATPSFRQNKRPFMTRGRIADDRDAGAFIHDLIFTQVRQPFFLASPRIAVSAYGCFNEVERTSLIHALSGIGQARMVSRALCAAFGSGQNLTSSRAVVLLSLGVGVSELAVILSGTQVFSRELESTREQLVAQCLQSIRQNHDFLAHPESVQKALEANRYICASTKGNVDIYGKNLETGKLGKISLPMSQIATVTDVFFQNLGKEIDQALRGLPTSLALDVVEQGVLIYGEFTDIDNLALKLCGQLEIPVSIVPEPKTCVIHGLKAFAESLGFAVDGEGTDKTTVLGC